MALNAPTRGLRHRPKTLYLSDWDCPAGLPEGRSGRFRVAKHGKPPGTYRLHRQYAKADYYELPKRPDGHHTRYTRLQERRKGKWNDWMTDEPLYWHSMAKIAAMAKGPRVLVGGLGLGLVLRHLAMRTDIKGVVVVERSPDVIRLCWEPLRKQGVLDERFWLLERDFFETINPGTEPSLVAGAFETVITDFWVGSPMENIDLFLKTYDYVNKWWPDALQEYHGLTLWADLLGRLPDEVSDKQRRQILGRLAPQ